MLVVLVSSYVVDMLCVYVCVHVLTRACAFVCLHVWGRVVNHWIIHEVIQMTSRHGGRLHSPPYYILFHPPLARLWSLTKNSKPHGSVSNPQTQQISRACLLQNRSHQLADPLTFVIPQTLRELNSCARQDTLFNMYFFFYLCLDVLSNSTLTRYTWIISCAVMHSVLIARALHMGRCDCTLFKFQSWILL